MAKQVHYNPATRRIKYVNDPVNPNDIARCGNDSPGGGNCPTTVGNECATCPDQYTLSWTDAQVYLGAGSTPPGTEAQTFLAFDATYTADRFPGDVRCRWIADPNDVVITDGAKGTCVVGSAGGRGHLICGTLSLVRCGIVDLEHWLIETRITVELTDGPGGCDGFAFTFYDVTAHWILPTVPAGNGSCPAAEVATYVCQSPDPALQLGLITSPGTLTVTTP